MSNIRTTDPFSAKEIIGDNIQQLLDPSSDMRKSFFWRPDSKDKRKVEKFEQWNVFEYADKFLPAFGFYSYRDPDGEGWDYRLIQKKGRFVRIIGNLQDSRTRTLVFRWTLETLKYLTGTACDLPDFNNLKRSLMNKQNLFDAWTLKFLPELPEVESDDGTGKWSSVPQRPLRDNPEQAHLCFTNAVAVVRKGKEPTAIPYPALPAELFIWDAQVRPYPITDEMLDEGAHGVWWDFMQNTAKEFIDGEWKVNLGMLKTLMTSYGYLLHDFSPPDQRKAVVLYDRTSGIREGGAGKSILLDGIDKVRPYHWIDGKRLEGEKRFIMEGYTEDRRVVVFSDILKDWKLEDYYNMISDGFTVEGKGQPAFVIPKQSAPKIAINTNYTIPAVTRSDRRRLHFVPISQFYGVLSDSTGKTPKDVHGGWLLDEYSWTGEDWSAFYVTCLHCLHQYLEEGLVPFDDTVLHDRQLLAAAGHDESLLEALTSFIKEVAQSGGECTRPMVLDVFDKDPNLERYADWKPQWKVRRFKDMAVGMGFQVNPGRERNQRVINGVTTDCYLLVKPDLMPADGAEEKEPPSPPAVKDGRFTGFLFGETEEDA